MSDETQKQFKKQDRAPQLEPWRFQPGVSGNPGGRPKGAKSLKTYAKEYLESLPDEEKLAYMAHMDKKIIWEMAEGKPGQDFDIKSGGEKLPGASDINVELLAQQMAEKLKDIKT